MEARYYKMDFKSFVVYIKYQEDKTVHEVLISRDNDVWFRYTDWGKSYISEEPIGLDKTTEREYEIAYRLAMYKLRKKNKHDEA